MLQTLSALAKCCSDGLGEETEVTAALPGARAAAGVPSPWPSWGRLMQALTSPDPSLTALQRPEHHCGVKGMD